MGISFSKPIPMYEWNYEPKVAQENRIATIFAKLYEEQLPGSDVPQSDSLAGLRLPFR
jgi:hypothetical protein